MALLEDYYAAGVDETEEPALDAPVDPYADIDPELLGGELVSLFWWSVDRCGAPRQSAWPLVLFMAAW